MSINSLPVIDRNNAIRDLIEFHQPEDYDDFLDELEVLNKQLNNLIKKYNKSPNTQTLLEMQELLKATESRYKTNVLTDSKTFRNMKDNMFVQIKGQMELLGVPSVGNTDASPKSLPEIIANMSPDKVDELTRILARPTDFNNDKLLTLYDENDTSKEKEHWEAFLEENEVSYLGGGNSQNYKVKNIQTSEVSVLKVDKSNNPQFIQDKIKSIKGLEGLFTDTPAERLAHRSEYDGRRLVVTDFCSGGDLESNVMKDMAQEDRLQYCQRVFSQMADVFQIFSDNNYLFPDAKSTNWLVDSDGNLKIADTKSFIHTNEHGTYSEDLENNKYFGSPAYTLGYTIDELDKRESFDSDKLHSYILSKNLYQGLTGCDMETVCLVDNKLRISGEEKGNYGFDFSHEIFNNPEGELYKSLIENLHTHKISVKDAQLTFEFIKLNQQINSILPNDSDIIPKIKNWQNNFATLPFEEKAEIITKMSNAVINKVEMDKHLEDQLSTSVQEITKLKSNGEPDVLMDILVEKVNGFNDLNTQEKRAVITELKQIESHLNEKSSDLNQQLKTVLDEIRDSASIGKGDKVVDKYIQSKLEQFENCKSSDDKMNLIRSLKGDLKSLQSQKSMAAIQDIVSTLDSKSGLSAIGKNEKIDRISHSISMEDRMNLDQKAESNKDLLKALASRRGVFSNARVHLDKNKNISENKAASSYRKFKEAFTQDLREKIVSQSTVTDQNVIDETVDEQQQSEPKMKKSAVMSDNSSLSHQQKMSQKLVQDSISSKFENTDFKKFIEICATFTPDNHLMQRSPLMRKMAKVDEFSKLECLENEKALEYAIAFIIKAVITPGNSQAGLCANQSTIEFIEAYNNNGFPSSINNAIANIYEIGDEKLSADILLTKCDKILEMKNEVLDKGFNDFFSEMNESYQEKRSI